MGAHPSGDGASWTDVEAVDVDQPHGLDYRYSQHIAKAIRKRSDKEHSAYADATVGGEHVPGYCQVLRQVDGTADVTTAQDNTLFQANGLVHCSACESLWCITGSAGDPTILLLHPDLQFKGGDITWRGAAQFDASVDMTIVHVDASATFHGAVQFDGTVNFDGVVDLTDTQIDGTLTVLDRADFSSIGVAGDSTITGAVEFDGSVQVDGLMSFCANNVYDSTWFDVSVFGTYTKTHDLSSTCLLVEVWHKDVANDFGLGANSINQAFSYRSGTDEIGYNLQTLTTTQLTIQAGTYTNGCWSSGGNVAGCTSGSYRVIAMRLV